MTNKMVPQALVRPLLLCALCLERFLHDLGDSNAAAVERHDVLLGQRGSSFSGVIAPSWSNPSFRQERVFS